MDTGAYEICAGGRIDTEFDVTIGRLTYGFTVINAATSEVALKAGLHFSKVHTLFRLSGAVFKDGIAVGTPSSVVN